MTPVPLPADISGWTANEVSYAVKARQDEKRRLDMEIARLFARQNDLRPISRLPDEILGAIFLQYYIDATTGTTADPTLPLAKLPYRPSPGKPILGAVCRRWKTVYNSHPALWSNIVAKSVEQVNIHLQRSKQSPLRVIVIPRKTMTISAHELPFNVSPSLTPSSLARTYAHLLVNAASRIRALDLRLPVQALTHTDHHEPWPTPEQCVMPSLVHLRIYVETQEDIDEDRIRELVQPLDGEVQPYSNLQCLDCSLVPWSFVRTAIRPSLTILRVSLLLDSDPITENDWLGVLKTMPQLVELSLSLALCLTQGEPQPLSGIVHLPHLTTLTLPELGVPEDFRYFNLWNHLRLPKLLRIYLGFKEGLLTASPEEFQRWAAPKCSDASVEEPYISAWLTWPPAPMLGPILSDSCHSSALGLSSADIIVSPSGAPLSLDKTSRSFCTSFDAPRYSLPLIAALPLSHITTFIIDHNVCLGHLVGTLSDMWEPLARKMTNVTTMHISNGNAVTGFLATLRLAAMDAAADNRPLEFFRNLKHLKLGGIHWANDDGTNVPYEDEEGNEADWSGWNDMEDCRCNEPYGDYDGCSCMPREELSCLCAFHGFCDCECGWAKERFNKLVVEALQRRDQSNIPQLRHLEIIARGVEDVYIPAQYSEWVLRNLVEDLSVKLP